MLKYLILLALSFSSIAQIITIDSENEFSHKYVTSKNNIYDVELILFAYRNQIPNYKTYTNPPMFDDSDSLVLYNKPEELSFIQTPEVDLLPISTNDNITSELTVPITDNEEDKQVLTWFLHEPDDYSLQKIWNKLSNQENIVPLLHQSWRQDETAFEDPTYIRLSTLPIVTDQEVDEEIDYENFTINVSSDSDNSEDLSSLSEYEIYNQKLNDFPDFTVSGKVALSQGRFMHFGHQLNLIRHYFDENNNKRSMVFKLDERKQLKTDELHYFDSPWFGSIVKITEFKEGDEENDNQ